MAKRNKIVSLTPDEKRIVKALLAKCRRNQDIQALINTGRKATINSGRITGVKKNDKQDLGTLALQAAQAAGSGAEQASETVAIGQSLLADLRNTEPVGRLVIDLDRIMAAEAGSPVDVILKDGDVLRVPQTAQEVTVIGEVQNSTSHLYDPALARTDYIRLSGGTTQKADNGRIYVVRANGSVEMGGGSRWFRDSGSMQPGDTVVVPLDAERMRPLPLWTAVSTILYNIAISVAAVNSF